MGKNVLHRRVSATGQCCAAGRGARRVVRHLPSAWTPVYQRLRRERTYAVCAETTRLA